jgi:xylose isomerase
MSRRRRVFSKEFEEGKLDFKALYESAKENGELTLQSGKQELF